MAWTGDNVRRFPADKPARAIEPLDAFTPAEWYGKEPPAYDWIVEGCLLRGTVGMLSGDGGIGKSLIMQQLLTAAAIGTNWLGINTQRIKGFGFFCEDDKDELHRRQHNINEHYGCDYPDVDALYVSRVGMENVLMEFDRRTDRALPTPLWDQTLASILDFGAQLVLIDTIADAYGGNEIVRNQVRRFITELRRVAVKIQGAVIITSHPSLTGMNSGTGLSGSTAWHNSVRSRMYLTKAKPNTNTGSEETEDTNERILRTMKNNQGPGSGSVKLLWKGGVFERIDEVGGINNAVDRISLDSAVWNAIANMVERGTRVGYDPFAKNSIGVIGRGIPELRAANKSELENAQARLLQAERLVIIEMGPKSRRYKFVRPPALRYPGEEGNP